MKGSVTKPDFKITIGADAGQIEANVVKAINEAVTSINKDTDTKLKKLKVQIDKEALKNQIQNSVSSVHIKQFDGLGKQIGHDIASRSRSPMCRSVKSPARSAECRQAVLPSRRTGFPVTAISS